MDNTDSISGLTANPVAGLCGTDTTSTSTYTYAADTGTTVTSASTTSATP